MLKRPQYSQYLRKSSPSNTGVKNGYGCTYTSLYAIMTCARTTSYLTFHYVTPNIKETPYILLVIVIVKQRSTFKIVRQNVCKFLIVAN